MKRADQEYITLARISKPQGRHGEVIADLFTDFPEKFAERRRLSVWDTRDTRRELTLENHWFHKGRVVFKFSGVESISDAEGLAGWEVQIPQTERTKLQGSAAYISDLIGCELLDNGKHVGTIQEVQRGAGDAPLLVVKAGNKEYLVPFVEEYVAKVDVVARRVEAKLPDGLLEVNAPLSDEEKRQR